MDYRLIHADENMTELGEVRCFVQFDAQISMEPTQEENDWMLQMPARMWQNCPIRAGHSIYIPGTEWGGVVQRVRHTGSEEMVRVYGLCWRGMLTRKAVCPPEGQTHLVLSSVEGNAAAAQLLDGWQAELFAVSQQHSGVVCSGSVRYRCLLDALYAVLEGVGRLRLEFADRRVLLSAEPIAERSDEIELSQEYEARIISDGKSGDYNHLLALGRGEMLERTVLELWRLPDGTVTDDPEAEGVPAPADYVTYIYDYSAVEDDAELLAAAKKKLRELSGTCSVEIELYSSEEGLELTDIVSVRDSVTDMTAALSVVKKSINISSSGVSILHKLA